MGLVFEVMGCRHPYWQMSRWGTRVPGRFTGVAFGGLAFLSRPCCSCFGAVKPLNGTIEAKPPLYPIQATRGPSFWEATTLDENLGATITTLDTPPPERWWQPGEHKGDGCLAR